MTFFEQELRKITSLCAGITPPVFAGRACYCDLGEDNRARLEFVTLGYADHYEALQATILNRAEGKVDSLLFRFSDIWGKKQVTNPNFRDGVIPYIWSDGRKTDWYVYHPNDADYKQLAASVGAYLDVFTAKDLTAEKARAQPDGKESVIGQLRESKRSPAPRGSNKRKNHDER